MSDATEGGSSTVRMTGTVPTSPPTLQAATGSNSSSSSSNHSNNNEPQCCSCTISGWACDDDPPSYASLIDPSQSHPSHQPHQHHHHHHHHQHHRPPWSYIFQTYESENIPDHRAFARPLVSIPLTSYRIFKIEPPCYAAATRQLPQQRIVAELASNSKSSSGSARKYSAILIAATVIIFLMALSLMVRLVTEKSFWRG